VRLGVWCGIRASRFQLRNAGARIAEDSMLGDWVSQENGRSRVVRF